MKECSHGVFVTARLLSDTLVCGCFLFIDVAAMNRSLATQNKTPPYGCVAAFMCVTCDKSIMVVASSWAAGTVSALERTMCCAHGGVVVINQ